MRKESLTIMMRQHKFLNPLIATLFLLVSLPLLAQSHAIPQSLAEKIISLQEMLQSGDEQKFADELKYIDIIKSHYPDYEPAELKEHIENDESRIKSTLMHLQFTPDKSAFRELCFEMTDEEEHSLTKKCVSASWDGNVLLITWGAENFDLSDKNGEVFESGGVFVLKYDEQRNELRLIDYGIAG